MLPHNIRKIEITDDTGILEKEKIEVMLNNNPLSEIIKGRKYVIEIDLSEMIIPIIGEIIEIENDIIKFKIIAIKDKLLKDSKDIFFIMMESMVAFFEDIEYNSYTQDATIFIKYPIGLIILKPYNT